MADIRYVIPGSLRLPPEREDGADPFKLVTQMQEYGEAFDQMPPLLVIEGFSGPVPQSRMRHGLTSERSLQ